MDIPCTVCEAPLHVWEYVAHLKACIMLNVGLSPAPVEVDALTVHYQDQQAAWRRNKANGSWVPGLDPRSA